MALGVFGGTFDPPHLGHLILAQEAQSQLGLDKVLWVLTAGPPHKTGLVITALQHRLDMLSAATCDNPDFEISRVDIDRSAPHYAVDTVRLIARSHPEAELIYLMGGDSLHDLPTWFKPNEFVQACDAIGVMARPGEQVPLDSLERQIPGIARKVRFVEAPLLEIASSDIRARVAQGRPFRYYLPPAVYQIILDRKLYLE